MEDTPVPVPQSEKSAPKRRIFSTTLIVTLVALSLLAVCAIAAPNLPHEAPPVVDGNWMHRDHSNDVAPQKPVANLNVATAVKPIKAGAKITKSDYKIEKQKKLNLDDSVEGKAWLSPDTDRLAGAVAKRDIPVGKIITSKDVDLN
jgi:hypothetical protein